MYTVSQLAKRWSVDRKTILKYIHNKKLPAIRTPGNHFRIPTDAVAKFEMGMENATEGDEVNQ